MVSEEDKNKRHFEINSRERERSGEGGSISRVLHTLSYGIYTSLTQRFSFYSVFQKIVSSLFLLLSSLLLFQTATEQKNGTREKKK